MSNKGTIKDYVYPQQVQMRWEEMKRSFRQHPKLSYGHGFVWVPKPVEPVAPKPKKERHGQWQPETIQVIRQVLTDWRETYNLATIQEKHGLRSYQLRRYLNIALLKEKGVNRAFAGRQDSLRLILLDLLKANPVLNCQEIRERLALNGAEDAASERRTLQALFKEGLVVRKRGTKRLGQSDWWALAENASQLDEIIGVTEQEIKAHLLEQGFGTARSVHAALKGRITIKGVYWSLNTLERKGLIQAKSCEDVKCIRKQYCWKAS